FVGLLRRFDLAHEALLETRRRAEVLRVGRGAAQQEVEIVVVRDADPAVELDAVLDQLGTDPAGVRLRGTGPRARPARAFTDGPRGLRGDRRGRFERRPKIRHAVLDLLVRSERTA